MYMHIYVCIFTTRSVIPGPHDKHVVTLMYFPVLVLVAWMMTLLYFFYLARRFLLSL